MVKRPRDPDDQPDDVVEVRPKQPVVVPQTNTLYRFAPVASDVARSRQVAIVAAESEAQARALATSHDPFGRDWRDEEVFACESERIAEPNIVGDVVFTSIPAARIRARKTPRSEK